MQTIESIIGMVVKAIEKEFVKVKVINCWLDLFRATDGSYGIRINAEVGDMEYEYDRETDKYVYRDEHKFLEGTYDLEIETIVQPDTEITEKLIGDTVWDVCCEFKIDHEHD